MSQQDATLTRTPRSGGAFVVSLDFELHWGVCDRDDALTDYRQNLLNVREVIPRLLELFVEFDIHATWATVGLLFFETKEELRAHLPDALPQYINTRLSAYEYLDIVGENEREDPLHFAPSLVEEIAATPGQRIASHTFSHYYCLERGQSATSFEADLQAAIQAARLRDIELESLVFPRNQLNTDYLSIIQRHGFRSYRGNPQAWMYEPRKRDDENLAHRGLRLLDAYLPLTGPRAHSPEHYANPGSPPANVPATRFLRPFFPTLRRLEEVRLQRIRREMEEAAHSGATYHLWWHPHNFGADIDENFAFLRRVLQYQRQIDDQYGLPSLSMAQAAQTIPVSA